MIDTCGVASVATAGVLANNCAGDVNNDVIVLAALSILIESSGNSF